jgi:hypothetical protein
MPVFDCHRLWKDGVGVGHHDVSLPAGWHLNQERVPVPPATQDGLTLEAKMRRCLSKLPQALR